MICLLYNFESSTCRWRDRVSRISHFHLITALQMSNRDCVHFVFTHVLL